MQWNKLWVIKGDNCCANIEDLPIKKSNFPYDPRLRDILKDLPINN
jgi:hypothetical protein